MSDNINKIKEYIVNEKSKTNSGDIEQYIYEDILNKIESIINESDFNNAKQKYGCGYWDICTRRVHFEELTEEDDINIGFCLVKGREFDNFEYEYMKSYEPDDELLKENLEYGLKELDNELYNLIEDDCFEDCYDLENYKEQRTYDIESECYKLYFNNTNCKGCIACEHHKVGIEKRKNIDEEMDKKILYKFYDDDWLNDL